MSSVRFGSVVCACLLAACASPVGETDASRADGTAQLDARDDLSTPPGDVAGIDASEVSSGPDASDASACSRCVLPNRCAHDQCVPDLGACRTDDDCPGDSYCDTDLKCVPYGVPATRINDPSCARPRMVEAVLPTVQCEWSAPPAGDPTANYRNIYNSPMVADLNLDGTTLRIEPSIVATTFDSQAASGVLRVFSGRTCEEQLRVGFAQTPSLGDEPSYGAQVAIGDLDGDLRTVGTVVTGHPEIVTFRRTPPASGGQTPIELIAYRIVDHPGMTPAHTLERAWTGRRCDLPGEPAFVLGGATPWESTFNSGPSLVDLDDDGRPEVIAERHVFDSRGCILNPMSSSTSYLQLGTFSALADVDNDGAIELADSQGVFRWDTARRDWVLEDYYRPTAPAMITRGLTAIADFGALSASDNDPSTRIPEVAVVAAESEIYNANGLATVRIQTITGEVVFGPYPLYGRGNGGAPTAADFDGDGWPEFAVAGRAFYTVYDPDCVAIRPASRPGGRCGRPAGSTLPPGVLWAQASQDASSACTGSSVFDFDGDGTAEAVYRDECFLRVYRGATGEVIYSAAAQSGTGYELPVIADVDGDFATEIVVPRARGVTCPATDPLFPSASSAGAGSSGFVILRDPMDRWAASRPVWNQHAYSVTHVTDDARIPRTRDMLRNWSVRGLNNFRQNVQGNLGVIAIADLTVAVAASSDLCAASGPVTLNARVCNRGTNPVSDGVTVRFELETAGGGTGARLCEARTSELLPVGACTMVTCNGVLPADMGRSVRVRVDPDSGVADCHRGNNVGRVPIGTCPG
ncbi:MAG: VCBS repeat-containing protein [Deltaproteobacteria bacterium]|nr:VCBS repeat-containing protein [Deltaproteobacteria bacterium]